MKVFSRRREGAQPPPDPTYKTILVPVVPGVPEEMVATAGHLATRKGAMIDAITVLEVPLDLPLDAPLPEKEEKILRHLERVQKIAESYGARVVTYIVRGRQAGRAIVEEAKRTGADVIMLQVPAKRRVSGPALGPTVEYVIANAPTRVLLSITPCDRPGRPPAQDLREAPEVLHEPQTPITEPAPQSS